MKKPQNLTPLNLDGFTENALNTRVASGLVPIRLTYLEDEEKQTDFDKLFAEKNSRTFMNLPDTEISGSFPSTENFGLGFLDFLTT